MLAFSVKPVRHTRDYPCLVCSGYESLRKGRGVRCAGMTGEYLVWCSRPEFAGNAPLDLKTSPPAFKHQRYGWCPCGIEHGRGLPNPEFTSSLRLVPPVVETSTADERALRHEVYEYALSLLDLRDDALADLTRRGLSDADIAAVGYRSIPATLADRKRLVAAVVARFGEERVRRVPGFVDKNGRLYFLGGLYGDGYVVPYRDEHARITGVQRKSLLDGKYFTARTSHVADIYQVAGPVHPGCDLYVTEGGLKGQVATGLGNVATLAITGQSLRPAHIEAIKRLKPGRVIIALDQELNQQTDQARDRWARMLYLAGITPYVGVWEGADVGGPKGLDDLFFAGGRPRIRRVPMTPPDISARRVPRPTLERGPVAEGMTLPEARQLVWSKVRSFVRGALPTTHAIAQLVRTSPGSGKTTSVADSVPRKSPVRIAVGTKDLAAELAAEHGYGLVEGRNEENCQRHDVVKALQAGGHDIQRLACGTVFEVRCPHRHHCRYWQQFDQGGPLVGAAEQVWNPTFLRNASQVILDDADLSRAMIERNELSMELLAHAADRLLGEGSMAAARRIVQLVMHAMTEAPVFPPLQGPAVWDHLMKVATRESDDLPALIDGARRFTAPDPASDADGYISAATVAETPAALVQQLVQTLGEELPAFLTGDDFNSRMRLDSQALELAFVRSPALDENDEAYLPKLPVLILDATPIDTLVDVLLAEHERLPDVDAMVRLPDAVTVIQCAGRTNGHLVLRDEERVEELMAEVEFMRRTHPVGDPSLEAAVGFKDQKAGLAGGGFESERVLTFGRSRGTNVLKAVERLHVVGRPMPPPAEMAYLAQVIFHGEAPVSSELALVPRAYGGQPFEVDVVDFVDSRPAELVRAHREDELVQVLHRARLTAVGEDGDPREHAVVVLHTNHVVPGLRVDDLRVGWQRVERNTRLAQEAAERIGKAAEELRAEGQEPSQAAVARRAGAHRDTVAKWFGKAAHTPQKESLDGLGRVPKPDEAPAPSPTAITGARGRALLAEVGYGQCPGGCDWLVPIGRKCRECEPRPEDEDEEIMLWAG